MQFRGAVHPDLRRRLPRGRRRGGRRGRRAPPRRRRPGPRGGSSGSPPPRRPGAPESPWQLSRQSWIEVAKRIAALNEAAGLPGDWPTGYDDPAPYTPAWQEEHTGVPAAQAERFGREFAQNALDSGGRSMILMGAGTNHWYHSDQIYRAMLVLTSV